MTDDSSAGRSSPEAAPDAVTQPALVPAAAAADAELTQPVPAASPPPVPSQPPASPPARSRSPLGVLRSLAVGLTFVLACLGLVVATTAWWVDQTFLDTDAFVAVTAPLVDDPEVQEALAQATATQVSEALDLGPLGTYVVAGVAGELFSSDAFAQLWEGAMRAVHTVVIALLEDDANVVDMVDGQVYVNLYPFLDWILDQLATLDLEIGGEPVTFPTITDPSDPAASRAELEAYLGRPLPETFGTVPVARGENLVAAQQAFAIFETSIVVLAAVTLLLAIATIVLARRRIRMIALLGVGALASLLVARLAIAALQDAVADAVTSGGQAGAIGEEIVAAVATSYRELTEIALLLALVAAVVATAVAWALDRRARAAGADAREASIADGWFLAIAGLCIALAALILAGLTVASFVVVALAYGVWLVIVARTRRRAAAPATA